MCGCDNQTPVGRNGAGAIAIIHTTLQPSAEARQIRLFFSNSSTSPMESTQVSLGGEEVRPFPGNTSLSLRIHNHGDLTTSPSSSVTSLASEVNEGQHVLRFVSTDNRPAAAELRQRLDLGVGGEGVIGKMVSLCCNGHDLGNGIIGWN